MRGGRQFPANARIVPVHSLIERIAIMTGYTVHTGTSDDFVVGWDNIFQDGSTSGRKSAAKTSKAGTRKSKKKASAKKTAKKKPAQKKSAQKKTAKKKSAQKKTAQKKSGR